MIEGTSPFICFLHGFETDDISKWNGHISSVVHYEEGICPCSNCGTSVTFTQKDKVKATPIGQPILVLCKGCKKEAIGQ